jgi:ubiquinol-cytochrome c reductase iron-sulfur subunit
MAQSFSSTVPSSEPTRRDFLTLVTFSTTAIGVGALAWPLIDSMEPGGDVLAAGGPIDVDLAKLEPGQQIVVMWRGAPIFVVDRTPAAQETLKDTKFTAILRDPNSDVHQQPPYAKNWSRSIDPKYAVLVGICTHLGCIPGFYPNPSPTDPAPDWRGGYLCPCHGSKYDLAGRVFQGVPAPYNLPVPPYHFPTPTSLRIGENPAGVDYELNSVVQM